MLSLGITVLLGCTNQTSTPAENKVSPTAQSNQVINEAAATATNPPPKAEQTEPAQAADSQAIVILMADEVNTLDPYRMANLRLEGSIAGCLWDTLVRLNNDLQIEPSLAESWQLVNNFTWEFKLHEGISFHNGEPVNAEAVKSSIERAKSLPDSLETFAKDVDLAQIEIVDDYTLRLTSNQPVANLPYHLAFLEILPPVYYTNTNPDQLAVAPVGSGPYQVGQWTPGQKLVLEAVPTYWQGQPALPRLVFRTAPHFEERLAALRSGQADLVTDLPPMSADQWNIPNSHLGVIESTRRMFVGIPLEAETPFADKRVRQALNYGINVRQIVAEWLGGYGERYGSWVNPPANNPELKPWPYDPELARKLLAESGYQEGFTTTLRTPMDVYYQDVAIAKAMAQQWAEIGVVVNVETVDWNTYVRELLLRKPDALVLLSLNSRGDGLEDVKNLSADFPFNPTNWKNESFEQTLNQAVNTFNENSRNRLLNQAQTIAYDEAPWIWLWRPYDFYGVSDRLDWTPRRDGLVYLYKAVTPPAEDSK